MAMTDEDIQPLKPYARPLRGVQFVPVAPHPGAFGARRKFDHHTGVDLYATRPVPVFPIEDGRVVDIIEFTGEKAIPASPWWNRTQAVLVEGRTGVILYGEVSSHWVSVSYRDSYMGDYNGYHRYHYLPYFDDNKHFPDLPEVNAFPEADRLAAAKTYHFKASKALEGSHPDALSHSQHKVSVGDEVEAGKTPIGCIVPVLKKVKPTTISRFMVHIELLGHGQRVDAGLWEHGKPCPEGCYDPTPLLIQALSGS